MEGCRSGRTRPAGRRSGRQDPRAELDLDLEQVASVWPAVLDQLAETAPALAATFEGARPVGVRATRALTDRLPGRRHLQQTQGRGAGASGSRWPTALRGGRRAEAAPGLRPARRRERGAGGRPSAGEDERDRRGRAGGEAEERVRRGGGRLGGTRRRSRGLRRERPDETGAADAGPDAAGAGAAQRRDRSRPAPAAAWSR